jgi:predicted transcriptional regulator of viral defense system
MPDPKEKLRALRLMRRTGVVRPVDFEAGGIPRSRLYGLVREGLVERQSRGVYVAADHPYTEHNGLAQVAKRVPAAVVCLLSALRFHEITTQNPFQIWIALPEKARKPRMEYPPIRVVRFSGTSLTEGVETHKIEGVEVRVYSLAKTIADCFKYRHKIGLDVALEALRESWQAGKVTMDQIDQAARACRMQRVMRPYLEALVG